MALDIFTYMDLILLALFIIFFSSFLYSRRRNLKREGLLYLYRTTWGMKMIEKIGEKYKKTLKVLSYVSIACGYVLMAGMIYLTYTIVKVYFLSPSIVRAIKVPPITPLIPYLPQVFKLDFLPPFYFSYWIIILAIVAITHEMAHGIFMKRYGIKIKSTGFAFFPRFVPIFPAAFVEQDEESMEKAGRFEQMATLSAGTFANVLTAILFMIVLMGFSVIAFSPSGVIFDTYSTSMISVVGISAVNNVSVTVSSDGIVNILDGLNEIEAGGTTYLATRSMLEEQTGREEIIVYNSAPAIRENLSRIITEINGVTISSLDILIEELSRYAPGDEIKITTLVDDGAVEKTVVLDEHPDNSGSAWLGIGFMTQKRGGIFGSIVDKASLREQNVYYKPLFNGMSIFIYNLLWWLVLISISVALINMLPVGIFDGGRFFYLTILGITKNKKVAERAFTISTYLFLLILVALMLFWVKGFFG
ncbi:MAG: site-2 protease family protein [Nanoarchaeota archaeon]|nr:site-2 protease family protein [Nanoarchaeota archaeon]MBU1501182.1 site-2 protease family protein [Nanoarchaeota archaeon]MBU2459440.1 site-2 protease family protein [Nanoarchaeota archaeon]